MVQETDELGHQPKNGLGYKALKSDGSDNSSVKVWNLGMPLFVEEMCTFLQS